MGAQEELEAITNEYRSIAGKLEEKTKALDSALERAEEFDKTYGDGNHGMKGVVESLRSQVEDLETKMARPHGGGSPDLGPEQRATWKRNGVMTAQPVIPAPRSEEEMAERKAFVDFCRTGNPGELVERVASTDDGPKGGYLVPAPMRTAIRDLLVEISPIRPNAEVVTITQGSSIDIPKEIGEPDAGWVGEREERGETDAPRVGMVNLALKSLFAQPKATQEMLDDSGINFEQWIVSRLARTFNKKENQGFINGAGNKQPEGILTNQDIDRVKTGAATAVTADGLLDLIADLPTEYAQGAALYMTRRTTYAIRKLKDENNQYLWQPSLQAGLPNTFAGFPVVETPDMPEIAADAEPIFFGNLGIAYTVGDKSTVGMIRDEVTAKGFIKFYSVTRVGGVVARPEAIRVQEVKA